MEMETENKGKEQNKLPNEETEQQGHIMEVKDLLLPLPV